MSNIQAKKVAIGIKVVRESGSEQLSENEQKAVAFVGQLIIDNHKGGEESIVRALLDSLDVISRVTRGTVSAELIPTVNDTFTRIANSKKVIRVMEDPDLSGEMRAH